MRVFANTLLVVSETDVLDLGWLTTRGMYFYPMLLSSSMASLSIQSDSSSMKALSRSKQRKTCTGPRNENTTKKSNSPNDGDFVSSTFATLLEDSVN